MKINVSTVAFLLLASQSADCQETTQLRHGSTEKDMAKSQNTGGDNRRVLRKKAAEKKPKKRVVVRYKSSGGKEALLKGQERKVYHDFDDDNVIVLDLDDDEIQEMSLNEDIEAVEHDYRYEELGHFVRELDEVEVRKLGETVPYGVSMVQANQVSFGSTAVKVCMADTGVIRHPDLPTNMAGADRTSSSGKAIYWDGDRRGHGTHIAGTVAARKGNGVGVVGVAPGASLYITRALDDDGSARESDIYQAIKQCADAGAKVISLSLGGGGISSSFKSLLDKLYYQQDIVIVAASGNDGRSGLKYPAAHPTVIAVGALSSDYSLWSGSNWGSGSELVAPGNSVLSTTVNGRGESVYSLYSGTSMATPHVAGVAALLRSHYPGCSNNQIRFAMAYSARDLDDSSSDSWSGCDKRFGYGLVQAKSALNFLSRNSCSGNWGGNADQGGCDVI